MENRPHRARYWGVALAAGLLGAAVGLLLAPAPGRETRRRMRRRLADERDALRFRGQRAVENARSFIRQQLREADREGRKAVSA